MTEAWPQLAEDTVRLLAAVLFGGAIGMERELSGKPAGLRTNVLIAVGATLVTLLSVRIAGNHPPADPGRIAAQIVTGVGFLGAGTIIQSRASVVGLTTAATIWAVAGIGIAVGAGHLAVGAMTTVLILVCLTALRPLESWTLRRTQHAEIHLEVAHSATISKVLSLLSDHGVVTEQTAIERGTRTLHVEIVCDAPRGTLATMLDALLELDDVESVTIEES